MNSRDKGANKTEEWRDVKGYEGLYQVSNLGNVRSLKRASTSGRIIKPYTNKRNGYCYLSLSKGNVAKTVRVHRLVMEAFRPCEKKQGYDKDHTINHIDGDKTNNTLDNLEWCSQSENQIKAYEIGINGKSCRKVIDLTNMKVYESMLEAAKSVGGKKSSSISRVCDGTRSNYRNHTFAYYSDYINGTIPEYKGTLKKRSAVSLWR